jgi:hypothetical protein
MKRIAYTLCGLAGGILMLGAGCGMTEQAPSPVSSSPTPATSSDEPIKPVEMVTPSTSVPVVETSSAPVTDISQPVVPPSSPTTTVVMSGKQLVISQWGITLDLPKGVVDLHYSLKRDGDKGYAYFSSKSIIDKGGNTCEADQGPLGALIRTKTLTSDGSSATPSNALKVGEYYYYYFGPQTTCTNDGSVQTLIDTQMKLVEQAVPTVHESN